jgi:serine acetyltransferase
MVGVDVRVALAVGVAVNVGAGVGVRVGMGVDIGAQAWVRTDDVPKAATILRKCLRSSPNSSACPIIFSCII